MTDQSNKGPLKHRILLKILAFGAALLPLKEAAEEFDVWIGDFPLHEGWLSKVIFVTGCVCAALKYRIEKRRAKVPVITFTDAELETIEARLSSYQVRLPGCGPSPKMSILDSGMIAEAQITDDGQLKVKLLPMPGCFDLEAFEQKYVSYIGRLPRVSSIEVSIAEGYKYWGEIHLTDYGKKCFKQAKDEHSVRSKVAAEEFAKRFAERHSPPEFNLDS